MLVTATSLRRRISRSIVTILAISSLASFSSFSTPVASAVPVTVGDCSIDGTNTSNFSVIDSITADGTCMVRFTTGTSSFVLPTQVNSIRALVVGGGGGGGFGGNGGGGGAGAVISSTSGISVSSGATISAIIGNGGLSPINKDAPTDQAFWGQGAQGETSTLTIAGSAFNAVGGGGGGGSGNTDKRTSGVRGGSGGGSAIGGALRGEAFNIDYPLWTEQIGAGFRSTSGSGGAGGGAGATAINSNGAIGVTVLGYAVGGGGAGWASGTNGTSGPFGGGAPRGGSPFPCTNNSCHGIVNTGGGGGGGGDGGRGVALVKFIPARNQGTIATTGNALIGRTQTFTFTRTNAVATGISASYQWQVKPAGSSTWNNVSTGSGGTTTAFTTASLTPDDSGNAYRIMATDTSGALGISTTSGTEIASVTIPFLETDFALNFNGATQFARAADNNAFDLTNAFTIQAWVRPTNVSGYRIIVSKEDSFLLYITDGVYTFSVDGASSTWSIAINNIPVVANEWHHIAVVRSASQINYTFYLDGVAVYVGAADTLGTQTPVNTNQAFTIGSRINFSNQNFLGSIDNVAGFSTARTAGQIQADMNGYIDANTTGLQYYYDFNEGSGTIAYNHAASGSAATDLTISGGATYSDIKTVDSSTAYTEITFPRTYITPLGGWRSPASRITYNALVVAGGGAGGARVSSGAGGGGGAGGMIETSYRTLDTDTVVSVRIGHGGLGSLTGTMSTIAPGDNGGNTVLIAGAATLTAIGGGGGGGGTDSDLSSYAGKSGGSGGGASGSSISGYAGGAALQGSGSGFTGFGNAGGRNPGCPSTRAAGGGGGAGAVGVTPTTCSPASSGNGGAGRTSAITGALYAGGGGGGTSGDGGVTAGTGGSGVGANGGTWKTVTGAAGTINLGNSATANTGGGGGGTGISTGITRGGGGAGGVVVIRYLSVSLPTYTDPENDTTTAGLTHTFTVTGSAPSPFVRTFKWQSSSDSGTTWSDVTTGSGFTTASYTTPILETMTSGARYQYRVMVIDTDAGTVLSDISTSAFLMINARLVLNGTYTIMKYGTTHTDTFTVPTDSGTGNKIVRRTSSAKPLITWDTSTANTAAVTVATTLPAGIYYDTITVTDEKSVTSNFPITITVLKADTVTVTVASRNDTYTASSLSYTDTFTVTGLVAGDSLTSVSYLYSGIANDGTSFSNAARPAIAGQYVISPVYTLVNFASYESVTVTSGTLTINRKLRTVEINTKPATLKYGDTSTVIAGTVDGASDGELSYQSTTTSLCLFSGAVLQAIEAVGTCSYTATIGRGNNFDTATSIINTTTLALADTLTVTVLPITALTYTGNQAVVTPRMSISGFKLSDTTTASSASFSYRITSTTDSFTATAPTFSDTYTVRADTLTVTSGLLSRYRAITYIDGTLRINRAQQTPLNLAQYSAIFGSPYRIISYGGSGVGAIIGSVSAGSAAGCFTDGETVTTTTEGSCLLTLIKAQDRNHETATVSALIYFLNWVAPVVPAPTTGPTIAITGENTVTVVVRRAPVITSLGNSGDASYPVAIYGAGFQSLGAGTTEVKFGRSLSVYSPDFVIVSDSLIKSRQPMGAPTAQIRVINENGMAISQEAFVPVVNNSI